MPRQKSTHVDDPRAVGERLKAARERAGLSQRQLSFPGCSPAYISRIESGDRIPSLQLLRELGRRLDDLETAEDRFTDALKNAGNDGVRAEALAGLGHVEFRRGRPRAAIERF